MGAGGWNGAAGRVAGVTKKSSEGLRDWSPLLNAVTHRPFLHGEPHSGPVHSATLKTLGPHKNTPLQPWGAPHPECQSPLCLTRHHSSRALSLRSGMWKP